MKKKKSGTVIR